MEEQKKQTRFQKNVLDMKIIEQSRFILSKIANFFSNDHVDDKCLDLINSILSSDLAKEFLKSNKVMIIDIIEHVKKQEVVNYTPSLRNQIDQSTQKKLDPLLKNTFRTLKTPGDGHCFYHAVSFTLFKNTKFYPVIRLLCVKFILDNLEYFKCLRELCAIDSIANLIQNIAALDIISNEQWGDNNSVIALSLGLEREFFVNLIYDDKITVTMFQPCSEPVINSPIFLVLNGNHYSSLLPMIKGQHLHECLNQIRQECTNKNMIQKLDIQVLKSIFGGERKFSSINSIQTENDYVNNPHMVNDIIFSSEDDNNNIKKLSNKTPVKKNTPTWNVNNLDDRLEDFLNKSLGDLHLSATDSFIDISSSDAESEKYVKLKNIPKFKTSTPKKFSPKKNKKRSAQDETANDRKKQKLKKNVFDIEKDKGSKNGFDDINKVNSKTQYDPCESLEYFVNKSLGDLNLSDSYETLSSSDCDSQKQYQKDKLKNIKKRTSKVLQSPKRGIKRKAKEKTMKDHKKKSRKSNLETDHMAFLKIYFNYRQNEFKRYESGKKSNILSAAKFNFLKNVNKMPDQICICCEGLFYKIKKFDIVTLFDKFNKKHQNHPELLITFVDFEKCIKNADMYTGICYTCCSNINNGKIPILSTSNGLKLPNLPDCVKSLTELEERFVCPFVNFIKFVCLKNYDPNAQLGAKGSVINVPTDVEEMVTTLPRSFNECKYVHIVFKRKLEHETKFLEENVNVQRIIDALTYLQDTPLYKEYGIKIDLTRLKTFEGKTNVPVSELDNNIKVAIQDMLKEDENDEENIDHDQPDFDALVVKNLIIDDDCVDKKIVMAPGEGKKPIPRYKINNYDRLIMPSIFGGQPEPFVNRKPYKAQNDSEASEHSDDSVIEYDKPLSRTRKYKSWLRNYDTRIRKPRYVLHMAKVKLEEQVLSGKSVMLRKSAGKKTVTDLLNDNNVENLVSNDQAFKMFTTIRGSPTYWSKKRKDIFCMFRQFGPATLFFTLSQGETYEPILLQYMFKLQKGKDISIEEAIMLDESVKAELIRNDPVACAEFFNNKIKEFMKYLRSKTGPFKDNPIEHYLWRIEYQMRGTMHAHGMLWLKDAPKFNPDDPSTFEENENFIDKYISVFRDTSNPLLSFQQHRHTFCCHKGKKNKKKCRFYFPRPPMKKTKILIPLPDDISNAEKDIAKTNFKLLSDKLKSITKKNNFNDFKNQSYEDFLKYIELNEENYLLAIRSSIKEPKVFYKRNVYSIMTNNYNEDWLIWNSNIDVQFLHDSYRAVYYVGVYIGKDPAGVSNIILEAKKKAEKGNVCYATMLKMVAESFINFNFMSAQEAVNQILGYAFFQNSESVVYIDTKPINNRTRMKKSKKELQKIYKTNPNSLDVFVENQIDRYSRRPKVFEPLCLAEYVATLNIKKTRKKTTINKINNSCSENELSDLEEEQNIKSNKVIENGYEFSFRRKPKCINWFGYKEEQDPLNYYREMIMLFFPWRDEKEDVESCNLETVYEKNFNEIKSNYDKYVKISSLELEKEYDRAQNDRKDLEIEDEEFEKVNAVSKSQEVILDEPKNDTRKKKTDQIETVKHYKVDENIQFKTVQEKMQKLNKRQREIIMHFLKCLKEGKQELVVLLGSAGTGKSLLIETLSLVLTYIIKKRPGATNDNINVLITAPTGKAAFNVNGYTNHHAFVLPVSKYYQYKENGLPNLDSSLVNTLSCEFRDLFLWINDEISMVGANQFTFIDTRLKQIKNSRKNFGGLSCLLVGDLKQLAPVGDKYIYKSNTKENSRSYLWDLFSCIELTEIMRQKDDLTFSNALQNIGKCKATEDDIALINSRKVKCESDVPKEAIWLYFTNVDVDNYNNLKIKESKEKGYEILPHDSFPKNISKKVQSKLKNHLNTLNLDDSGGLPNSFVVKLGIKYMVTTNVNTADGLCNGACGTVKFLSMKDKDLNTGENIEIIWLDFKNERVGKLSKMKINKPEDMSDEDYSKYVPIQRYTHTFTPPNFNVSVTRTQFPLRAAEAVTIHKSQGQTYESVCVDVRPKLGSRNYKKQSLKTQLLYVALSRVRSLSNLYILGNLVISNNKENSTREALNEIEQILAERPLKLSFDTFDKKDKGLIVYHNCQSLVAHYDDIKCDQWYFNADVLILSETNSKISDNFDFTGFTVFHRTDGIERLRGRGILYYARNLFNVEVLFSNHSNPNEDHCDLTLFKTGATYVISGYRSPKCGLKFFANELSKLLTYISVGSNIIFLGDMNEGAKALVEKLLLSYGCISVMPENIATTDLNTNIDIVLTNDKCAKGGTYESYFSYHKPIYIYSAFVQKKDEIIIKTENITLLTNKKSSNDPQEKNILKFKNAKTVSDSKSKLLEQEGIKTLDRILDYDEQFVDEKKCIEQIFKYLSSSKTLICFESHLKCDDTIKITNEQFVTDLHPLLNSRFGSIDVKGDGTCFYRAVSYTLFRTEDYHPWIRLIAIKSMICFKEYFIKITTEIFNDCTFYDLIIQSAILKNFAEHLIIYSLCLGLSRKILINICNTTLIYDRERSQNEIQIFSINNNSNTANSIMLRLSGQHYKPILLQPKQTQKTSLNFSKSWFINVLEIFNTLKKNIHKESSTESQNTYILNEHQKIVIDSVQHALPTDEIIFKFRLKITKSHLNSLSPGVWLNSDIVNFYLKLIMQRCDELKSLPTVYSFESYFLNALNTSFDRAKEWVKNFNLFSFDIILIPVHVGENHWCLVAIYTEKQLICYYDSMNRKNDSLLSRVKLFLEFLIKKTRRVNLNLNNWSINYPEDCPSQTNSDDCGVFCLCIAEHLARKAPLTFSQEHMTYFRKKIMYEIIMGNIM